MFVISNTPDALNDCKIYLKLNIHSLPTLSIKIQGLLNVIAENARHHDRQFNFKKR